MELRKGIRVLLWIGIVVLLQLSCSEAGLHITSGLSPIQAPLRHNVTIPCFLTDDNIPQLDLDLSTAAVRWEITPVHGEQHKVYLLANHIHTPFRPKSHIEQTEFKKGNASLLLQDVQESDEGEYTCSIFITPDKLVATIAVQVSARPAITLSSSEIIVEPEHEKSVICEVNKFYPKSITIRWFKSSKGSSNRSPLDKETCNSVPTENGDGTFNATSLVLVKPSSTAEDGDMYYCLVTHRSFSSDQAVDFILNVKERTTNYLAWIIAVAVVLAVVVLIILLALALHFKGVSPSLSDITGAEYVVHMQKSNLSFMILGFTPDTLAVCVYVKRPGDSEKQQIIYRNHPNPDVQLKHKALYQSVQQKPHQDMNADTLKADLKLVKLRRLFFLNYYQCNIGITPDMTKDVGAELTVEVMHKALNSPISVSCTLEKISGECLTLSDIQAPEHLVHGQKVTLTCDFSKYTRGPLQVTWLKRDLWKQMSDMIIYENGEICDNRYEHEKQEENRIEGVYRSSSSLTFTVDISKDHGWEYVCKVEYRAIDQTKNASLPVQVLAIPVVGAIMPDPAIPSVGQQMTLSCDIHAFYPKGDLTVEWYKENEPLPSPNNEIKVDNDDLYNATSTVTLSLEMEDLGKTFQCKVSHQSMTTPEIREWTLKTPPER